MNTNLSYRGNHFTLIRKIFATGSGVVALLVLVALAAFRAQSAPRPQQSLSVWDGAYTTEQANRGEALFQQNCSRCHGHQLEGVAEAPALAGGDFLSKWNGLSVGDLFERMKNTMPQDDPGKLSGQQYADVLGFVLKANGLPAGQTEVGTQAEMLKGIQIDQRPPKAAATPVVSTPSAGNPDTGKQLFASVGCSDCHGSTAKSGTVMQLSSPRMELSEFVKSMRQPPGNMPSVSKEKASDTQLADIYAYLQSLKPDSTTVAPAGNTKKAQ